MRPATHVRALIRLLWFGWRLILAQRLDAGDALSVLARLSLVTLYPADPQRPVRVHGVIQRAVREGMTREQHAQTARACADALVEAWPRTECDVAVEQIMRANTQALRECSARSLWEPNLHRVLLHAGRSLGDVGLLADAITYWQHLADTAIEQLGPERNGRIASKIRTCSRTLCPGRICGPLDIAQKGQVR